MILCPACSASNDDLSNFCSECGFALKPEYAATVTDEANAAENGNDVRYLSYGGSHHGQFLPGTKVADRYRIVSRVGKGGMGEVYRADDLKLGQTVALKFLPKHLADDPQRLEHLHSEVRLTRQISHPNVCRVYDIGEVNGQHFLSMEYIDGEDLKILLRRIGRLPRDKGVQIAQQLCAGLASAHDRGILHRDLKPANIMIDGQGRARIADFGLARLASERAEGEVAGTPAYMAPEQLAHGETTIQSDIYSLGLILYELFTGTPVYKAASAAELLQAQQESGWPKPSTLVEDMDPSVEKTILGCLERERQHRPKSASAVAAALPGGDPLAAALAAGETPSPELVANVRDTGGVRPGVAAALLVAAIASAVIWFVHTTNMTVLPKLQAGDLAYHAAKLMEDFGYKELSRMKSVRGMMRYDKWLAHVGKPGGPEWSSLSEHQGPPSYVFWRRWSPEGFETRDIHSPWPSHTEPPQSTPGSVTVLLDTNGRLIALNAIPDSTLLDLDEPETVDAQSVLARAGLNEDELQKRNKQAWAPPTYCNDVRTWSGQRPEDAGGDFVAQAGWYRGRLVYFEMQWNWDKTRVLKQGGYDGSRLLAQIAYFVQNTGAILPFFLVFAWWNFRLGRSDSRGALCCALLIGTGYFAREIASIRLGEADLIILIDSIISGRHIGHALIHGFQAWVGYLAVEPFVRQTWPRSLVGWTRLSRGRMRDPQVGRELLVGILLGVVVLVPAAIVDQIAWRFDWPHDSPFHAHPQALTSTGWTIMCIIPVDAILSLIFCYVWLVLGRVITRTDWAAICVAITVSSVVNYDVHHAYYGGEVMLFDPATAVWVVLLSVASVLAMLRLGFLGTICVHIAARVMLVIPMSSQLPVDFSTQMLLGLGLLLTLAVYGFWVLQQASFSLKSDL